MTTQPYEEEAVGGLDRRTAARLLAYVRPYRLRVLAAVGLLLVASATELAGPQLYRIAIDRYIAPRAGAPDVWGLSWVAAVYLLVLGLGFSARWTQNVLMQAVGQQAMADLRTDLFGHLQRLPVAFFHRNPVGRLVTRVTHDVDSLNELLTSGLVAVFGDLVTLVGIVAAMLWLDWRLALVVLAVLPLVYGVTEQFRVRALEAYRAVRVRLARLNAYLNEQITGMSVVQVFNQEGRARARFRDLNEDYLRANLASLSNMARFFPAVQVMGTLAVALLLWVGGGRAVQGWVTLGVLVAMIQYAERLFDPIRELAEKFNLLQQAMASSERIFRLLDEPVTLQDPAEPLPLQRVRGTVEFQGVWFAYDAAGAERDGVGWALRGVSFRVEAGERVALVGPTGAGKSSVVQLLCRFYDPQRGRVLLDGVDVRAFRQQDLRRHVGLVLQDVFLFSGTILDNLRLWDPQIPMERVREAARRAGAEGFIERLPQGYHTQVGERGVRLSAGQRQLIALARALVHDPQVLVILDEATSSVDAETEQQVLEALRGALRGRTTIVVAHRLATVQAVDRILVLHRGRLVEEGTHRELMARDGVYAKLYRLQTGQRRWTRSGAGGGG
ncbi:MAG: ABC transporter ATP-binding protein [Armatimonadota bacterium]|nr:ABC transporter ATP-binding protein [Armatimonadota bacterium]MDR7413703.1 ABC transporter ATP-binding protein [Armatimonadota bacterium]MDR7430249.1 ABC transporter ATP-binding protein [Armatimonadota bacterium]MDR7446581.1 ABC transporter ATP-binding protein [Armatimonadota bacterium]MDR7477676.1 ABC transporter ATP-binding protein [Armatimonadota bacterium]